MQSMQSNWKSDGVAETRILLCVEILNRYGWKNGVFSYCTYVGRTMYFWSSIPLIHVSDT